MTRCPILFNWNMRKDGSCKRFVFCDEEHHKICGAHPIDFQVIKEIRSGSCLHKETRLVTTGETVKLRGVTKRVFFAICKKCDHKRRILL